MYQIAEINYFRHNSIILAISSYNYTMSKTKSIHETNQYKSKLKKGEN